MTVGLSGTLSADDILSQAEALRKEQEAMLAQRTAAATQAAQQAQSQFQQASEQPPADINPTDAFVQTLLGNLASTIGGEPSYREKAQENLKLSRVSLIQQRKANLEALQGAAERSAKAAQEAGDHEQEVKIRSQIESRNKALDQLNREADRSSRTDAAKVRADAQGARDADRDRNAKNSAIKSMITNVRQDPDVKNFVTVRDQFDMGIGATKDNLGDILLMRAIARVSDPMSSVREEEFKTFKGAQGQLAQYGVNLTKAMWGKGMLTDFGRTQMKAQLRNIYSRKKEQNERALAQHRRAGAAMGLEPEDIEATLRDFASTQEGGTASAAGTTPAANAPADYTFVPGKGAVRNK